MGVGPPPARIIRMSIGDLVRHKMTGSIGVIIKGKRRNGDYQVLFHGKKFFTRERFLELIQKKS